MRKSDRTCILIFSFTSLILLLWRPSTTDWTPLSRRQQQLDKSFIFSYQQLQNRSTYEVTVDSRSFLVDQKRILLLGGSIHYPRSTPAMWDHLLHKVKKDGLNFIQTYVFWNLHEQKRGVYDFSGNKNLTLFLQKIQEHGLFAVVRLGPYVCAEWNNGGLPVWLNHIPNMKARFNNDPWKREMGRFLGYVSQYIAPYLAKNGGPIIAAQIENEYQLGDEAYVDWCAEFAHSLNYSVPWIMCNGMAGINTLNSCNDDDCVNFASYIEQMRPGDPLLWTENEGWFQQWDRSEGTSNDHRSAEDVSYAVCRWFAIGGSFHNYYMWHGGSNYGRGAAAGITTLYANGANLHFDGLNNEPKKSHLQKLHLVLKQYQSVLLASAKQLFSAQPVPYFSVKHNRYVFGNQQRAFEYNYQDEKIIFIENMGKEDVRLKYDTHEFYLSHKSIIIVNSKGELLYNTSAIDHSEHWKREYKVLTKNLKWSFWNEDITSLEHHKIVQNEVPLEQLSLTQDISDYLVYMTTLNYSNSSLEALANDLAEYTLVATTCESTSLMIYIDGRYIGEANTNHHGGSCAIQLSISIPRETIYLMPHSNLTILSISMGIDNLGGLHYKGLSGKVDLGNSSIFSNGWKMYSGLRGEDLRIAQKEHRSTVPWRSLKSDDLGEPISWYQSSFTLNKKITAVEGSILLDCEGLGRGRLFINGRDLGRYWLIKHNNIPVQRYYQVPPDWLYLNGTPNLLTVLEETGATSINAVKIVFSKMVLQKKPHRTTATALNE